MSDGDILDLNKVSIAHWFNDLEKHKCGYCKDPKGSVSYGMWAEALSANAYQNLIDRGWRRSGEYCYKPMMNQTCCPQYTIKCCATELSLTKSQKKVIKKVNKFLTTGEFNKSDESSAYQENDSDVPIPLLRECPTVLTNHKIQSTISCPSSNEISDESKSNNVPSSSVPVSSNRDTASPKLGNKQKSLQSRSGPDLDRPRCKKAKLLRLERKQKKLQAQGKEFTPSNSDNANKSKTLEQFLSEIPTNSKHSLTLKLVPTSQPGDDWERHEEVEYQLYKKYQSTIHNDKDNSLSGFRRFLVNSPIKPTEFGLNTEKLGYGSYHQQYWLDDKLIAVGVIDILPTCISSVYFFYDPDYRFLTLGTYGSLRELEMTRSIQKLIPSIQYYYMGYYIHSCPKMRYKGRLVPSMLLCPESYSWIAIEKCFPKLDVSKYCRLNDDLTAKDTDECTSSDIDQIKVVVNYVCMFYKTFKKKYANKDAILNIAKFVGKKCTSEIIFILSDCH